MTSILVVLQTTAFAFIEDSEARREILKLRTQIKDLEQSLKESKSIIDGYKGGQIILLNRIEELSKDLARFRGFSEEFAENAISPAKSRILFWEVSQSCNSSEEAFGACVKSTLLIPSFKERYSKKSAMVFPFFDSPETKAVPTKTTPSSYSKV